MRNLLLAPPAPVKARITRVDAGEKTGDRGCFWLGMRNGFEKKNNGGIDQYGYAVQERSRTAREEHEQRSIF